MSYPPQVQQILDSVSEIQPIPPRPGVIALPDWSDQKLDELASVLKVPATVKELGTYKHMLYYFYNFYFNGVLPPGHSPHQIVYFFLSSLAYGSGENRSYFLSDQHFGPNGFFILPPVITPVPRLQDARTALPERHIPAGLTAEQRAMIENLYLTPEAPEKITFFNAINRLIETFDVNHMTNENHLILRLTGFLSLLLFRGISKDAIQLARGVNKKLIKEHIHNLAGWPIGNSYCPPCKICVDNCALDFNKGNSHANKMMTLILSSWKRVQESNVETHGLIPQVQAALLTHTAGNGLGLVMMLYAACENLGVTIQTLLNHTLTEQSLSSWKTLSNFLKKYLNQNRPEKTYMWARLISDGYFTEYAARAHPYLAGMFAGIIGSQQTIGSIKQAAWFVLKQHQAEQGYLWGKAVVAKLSQRVDVPQLPEGVEVSAFLEQQRVDIRQQAPMEEGEVDPFAGVSIENDR